MKEPEKKWADRASIFLFLCGLTVLWGVKVSGQEWNHAQKEVWKGVRPNWEALKRGDVEAVLAMKHGEAAVWFGSRPMPLQRESLSFVCNSDFDYEKPTTAELSPLIIDIFVILPPDSFHPEGILIGTHLKFCLSCS
jgi:hypothetical protein